MKRSALILALFCQAALLVQPLACDELVPPGGEGGDEGRVSEPGYAGELSWYGGAGGEGSREPVTGWFAVSTQQLDPTQATSSYVLLTDQLDRELTLDDAVVEVAGRGIAAGKDGFLYVGSDTGPELTRYEFNGEELVESGKISFAPQGVPNFAGYSSQFQFVSETKAYWFSRAAERIVVWNPKDFVLSGAIALPGINIEGHVTTFGGAPLHHDGNLYAFVSWDSRDAGVVRVPSKSAVVVVDTETDTAEMFVDERCGYARDGQIVGKWLYIVSEAVVSGAHYLNPANADPPCLIRFDLETNSFDPDYFFNLNELADVPAAGSLVLSPGGVAIIHTIDDAVAAPLVADGTITNPRFLASGEVWRTARIEFGDEPKVTALDTHLISASVLPFDLGPDLRVALTYGLEKYLYEVTDRGLYATERVHARVPGTVFSVVRLE